MDLEDIARELYALPAQEFTAARNAQVGRLRSHGGRELSEEVRRLRRPSAGAWVLNLLAREHADEVEPVVALGARLREAMGVLGAVELRALDQQRRELTRAVAARAAVHAAAAGQPVNAQVRGAVEESLRAAMVDEPAGRALLTGVLTETFTSTGLDPVDLGRVLAVPALVPARAVAVPDTDADTDADTDEAGDAPTPRAGDDEAAGRAAAHRAAVAAARAAVRRAEDARSEADDAAATAARRATRARTSRLELETRRDELSRALRAAEKAFAAAVEQEEKADAALEAAASAATEAAAEAEQARSLLDTVVEQDGEADLP